jgi:hypothetical protein
LLGFADVYFKFDHVCRGNATNRFDRVVSDVRVRLNQLERVLLYGGAGHEIARWPRGVSRHGPKQPSVSVVVV